MRLTLALFALPCAAGCALFPLQEADCRDVNWERRGYADGYGGHPQQYLRLARDCPRFGVQVSEADYFKGWDAGYDEWYRLIGSRMKAGG